MSIRIIGLCTLLWVIFSSNLSHAHHSFAATFKENETNTVEGTITEFRFRNPHVLIFLDVANDDGSVTNWMAEGVSATSWSRAGWQADSLSTGLKIRIHGNATIDGSPMVSIEEMHLLNNDNNVISELSVSENPAVALGQATEPEQETPAAVTFIPATLPTGEPNFTGTTSQIAGFTRGGPDSNDPAMPYNATGEAANNSEAWAVEKDPQIFSDMPRSVRQAGYTPYGQKIRQYPNHVTIEYEEYGSRRSIFFSDQLPQPGPPSRLGDSIARYEGDTLVIETVNLLPNLSGHKGKPLSANSRVVEVYRREDHPEYGTILITETTVHDPEYLTASWTISRTKQYTDGYEFIGVDCEPPLRERPSNAWPEYEWSNQ